MSLKSNKIKTLLPMGGKEEDFINKFDNNKFVIKIDGMPLIEKITHSFKDYIDPIYLIPQNQIKTSSFDIIANRNEAKIVSISKKTNSVLDTLLYADKFMNDSDEVLIIHPDSLMEFNFSNFLDSIYKSNADGILLSYKGFNPCDIESSDFARITINGKKVLNVIEKSVLNASQCTSAGGYYFKSWSLFKQTAKFQLKYPNLFGQHLYVSLLYNILINQGKKVENYFVNRFISFGKPYNINEYNHWLRYSKNNLYQLENNDELIHDMYNLIPAAGLGSRFSDYGYKKPKPLIEVGGNKMLVSTSKSLPKANENIFILHKNHISDYKLDKIILNEVQNSKIVECKKTTNGMALTCLLAEDLLKNKNKPILVSSCDYGIKYDREEFFYMIKRDDPDACIWTFSNYPDARLNPNAYAYLKTDNRVVERISEKVPISDSPHKDPIVLGVFYFKSVDIFLNSMKKMISKRNNINGEYYVATGINEIIDSGGNVLTYPVDQYLCWGTPNDLMTYEFWGKYFNFK